MQNFEPIEAWERTIINTSTPSLTASTLALNLVTCSSTGLPPSGTYGNEAYILNELPDPDFALRLGTLTIVWNRLDYMLRLFISRMVRADLLPPEKEANLMENVKMGGGQKKLIDTFKDALLVSGLDATTQNAARRLIDQIGYTRKPTCLYGQRCQYEHSAYIRTQNGNVHYFRVGEGNKTNLRVLMNEEVEKEKNNIDTLIRKLQNVIYELDQCIPSLLNDS